MKLIIQTLPTYFVEEDEILTALFDEGMDILHINKPDTEPLYMERLLSLIPARMYGRIMIHQNYYLQKEYDLRGIHIDNPDALLPDGFKRHVTRSTSRISDLNVFRKQCEYVLLHSLYDSLHDEVKASLTKDEIREANHQGLINKHVYALGGMSLENIHEAKDMGFGGVVICGDLWNRFSIQHGINFHELISHFRKLKKATY